MDQAVVYFGVVIENALAERREWKEGKTTHSEPKYTLAQLLDAEFKLPAPRDDKGGKAQPVGNVLLGWLRGQLASGAAGFKHYTVRKDGSVQP